MVTTKYSTMSDEELLHYVYTLEQASELEVELALRLEKSIDDGDDLAESDSESIGRFLWETPSGGDA